MDKKWIFFTLSLAIFFSPLSSMPHFEPAFSDSDSEIEPADEIMDEVEPEFTPPVQSSKRSREKDGRDEDSQPEVKRPKKDTTTTSPYRSFEDTLERCIENAYRIESLTKKIDTDVQQVRKDMTAMKKEDREQIKPTERKVVEIETYAKYVYDIINATKQSITSTSQSTALVPYQEAVPLNNRTDERTTTSVSSRFAIPHTSLIHRIIPYGLSASLLRLVMHLSVPSSLQGFANRAGQMSTPVCNAILNGAHYLVQPVESVMSSVANGVTTGGTFAYGVARQGAHRLEGPARAIAVRAAPVYNAVREGSHYVVDPVQAAVNSAATVVTPVYYAVRDGSRYIFTSSVSFGTAVASRLPTVSMPSFTPFARPADQPSSSQHNVGQDYGLMQQEERLPEAELPEKNETKSIEAQLEIIEKNIDSLKQAFNECSRTAQWLAEQNAQQLNEANEAIALLNSSLERMTQITARYNNDCDAVVERIKKMAEVIRVMYPIHNHFLFLFMKRPRRLAEISAAVEMHCIGGKFMKLSLPSEKAFYYLKLLEKTYHSFEEYKDIAAAQLMLNELDALLSKDDGDNDKDRMCVVA